MCSLFAVLLPRANLCRQDGGHKALACETGDRRGALALGLGFATTGALLNHGTQTT